MSVIIRTSRASRIPCALTMSLAFWEISWFSLSSLFGNSAISLSLSGDWRTELMNVFAVVRRLSTHLTLLALGDQYKNFVFRHCCDAEGFPVLLPHLIAQGFLPFQFNWMSAKRRWLSQILYRRELLSPSCEISPLLPVLPVTSCRPE